jgi:hypothetical protein
MKRLSGRTKQLIYIASPYSHTDKSIEHQRFEMVRKFTAVMLQQRYLVFSPIVYAHEMARVFNLPTDAAYWDAFNMSILRRSDALYLCCLDGWEESKGVQREISTARALYIPVIEYTATFEKREGQTVQ